MRRWSKYCWTVSSAVAIALLYLLGQPMNINPQSTTAAPRIKEYPTGNNLSVQTQLYFHVTDPIPPRIIGSLRLVFLSDTHGRHEEIPLPMPDGDVLFHLGDASDRGNLTEMQSFVQWLQKNSLHDERYVIDGNHDRDYDVLKNDYTRRDFMTKYEVEGVARVLRNEVVEILGGKMTVLGVTWSACENKDYSEAEKNIQTWRDLSEDHKGIDLVLSHSPPYTLRGGSAWHGSSTLDSTLKQANAPLYCFGHIHYGRGAKISNPETTLVNCATVPLMKPVVIDYCPSSKRVLMIHCPVLK